MYKRQEGLIHLEFINKIKDFYSKKLNGIKVNFDGSSPDFFHIFWENENNNKYLVELYYPKKHVSKNDIRNSKYVPLDRDELKFFDMLQYTLYSDAEIITGQDITDWF